MTVPESARSQPFLSVVIPTHNRSALLQRVLTEMNFQTLSPDLFEVIVVIDGSTDETRSMLRGVQSSFVLRIIDEPQAGPAAARNRGILAARGQAILFLDDDVVPTRELLEAHKLVHQYDKYAVVIGRVLPCDGPRPGWEHWEDAITERDYRRITDGARVDGSLFYTWNVSVGRKCLDDVGLFDTSLAFQEDVDLGFRLQAASARFYFRPEAAGYHCGHRPTFEAWCRRHYRFGFYRQEMQRRGGPSAPKTLRESYAEYHPLTRILLRITTGRPRLAGYIISAVNQVAGSSNRAQLRKVANYCYSAVAVYHYWRGVRDNIGDTKALRSALFANNPSTLVGPPLSR